MIGLEWETGSPVSQVLARSSDLSTQQTCLLRSTTISVMISCRILARCCSDHNTTCSACFRFSCHSLTHPAACQPPPLSAYTQAYDVKGFFTGVRSRVTIHKPAAVVYQSLSTNLHHVFTPMTVSLHAVACYNVSKVCCQPLPHASSDHTMICSQVCDDTIEEDDGQGNQKIFRVIRIPFRVVFASGNLKLRFHVDQSRKAGKV